MRMRYLQTKCIRLLSRNVSQFPRYNGLGPASLKIWSVSWGLWGYTFRTNQKCCRSVNFSHQRWNYKRAREMRIWIRYSKNRRGISLWPVARQASIGNWPHAHASGPASLARGARLSQYGPPAPFSWVKHKHIPSNVANITEQIEQVHKRETRERYSRGSMVIPNVQHFETSSMSSKWRKVYLWSPALTKNNVACK